MPAPTLVTRHFLGWHRPVLELAAGWLLQHGTPGWPDLSRFLAVAPTRHAGRRLRERLAHLGHQQGLGVLPPRVVPPEALLSLVSRPRPDQGRIASAEESFLAWVEVLLQADLDDYPALFPVKPVSQDLEWALGTGEALIQLRRSLGESGLEIANVPEIAGEDLDEPERWEELSQLEAAFQASLEERGLIDLLTVRREQASRPDLPEALEGIAVLASPDPLPLALEVIAALSANVPVHVLIHAPPGLADAFDSWGRPLPSFWTEQTLSFEDFEHQVLLLPGPLSQAEEACRRAIAYERPAHHLAVGVLDEEVVPLLEERLDAHSIPSFNPQGFTLRARGPVHLLRTLRDLLRQASFATFLELLRCADFAAWLARSRDDWDQASVLEDLDHLARKHLPQSMRDLRRILNRESRQAPDRTSLLRFTFRQTRALLRELSQQSLPSVLPRLLQDLFSARALSPGSSRLETLQALARRAPAILDALGGDMGQNLPLRGADGLDLFLRFLETESVYPDRPSGAVDLLGWLELHWEDAPHLILTGCNDGFVPDSIVGDIYLPERLRSRLARLLPVNSAACAGSSSPGSHFGFKTNEQRFARDAYLLEAMLQSRRDGGRLDLFLGKRSLKGEPLRPSRLLFLCPDSALADRTRWLFQDVPEREGGSHWTPGFHLRPRGLAAAPEGKIQSLPVTAFRDYLASPFLFYLRHLEKMRPVEGARLDMDAAAFGELLHECLRKLGQEEALRDSTHPEEIAAFLSAQAGAILAARFGPEPELPIRVQGEAARQRLRAAAEIQAQLRREGWRIEQVETPLGRGEFVIDGVTVQGRVDRIDRHQGTGAIRVIDYKTSESAKPPQKAHVVSVTASTPRDWLPEYALFEVNGKKLRWRDLQLPLYRQGLAAEFGMDIECGYFNLPKSLSETGLQVWDTFSPEFGEAALHCARGILTAIRQGRFWPAPVSSWRDEFFPLHLGRPEQTIDASALQPA